MRLISTQENLKKALSITSHGTGKNINLPILSNILIRAKNGIIELISTNLEIGIIYQLRGKIEVEGEFTVDSKVITEYINLLPGENILLEVNDNSLQVECLNYQTKIRGESAQEFPLIPNVNQSNYYYCEADQLRQALNSVIFAASISDNRVELAGVLFNFEDNELTLAATDSYRLAEKKLEIKAKNDFVKQRVIVPARTIQELLRILSNYSTEGVNINNKEGIKISVSDNQILFSIDSVELVSRLISGQYPDYQQIIPDKTQTTVRVNRSDFLRAAKATAIFSKVGINDINLELVSGKIIISASSGQTGESRVEISADISGDNNEIAINYRYLVDGLNNLNSEEVIIGINSSNTPCVLTSDSDPSYCYVVMPIKQ
ncbi:MAG: DNA polymerase III subunit beta [Patescibacteria group bacterium]|jgi:DNA polymerase-3 subunit beta